MNDSGGELTVKSQLQDGQLQFSVSDTGVGLPMEKMDQIFSAFFTTKLQGSAWGWPSAVPLWSRTAGSCGQAPTVEAAQLFISPTDPGHGVLALGCLRCCGPPLSIFRRSGCHLSFCNSCPSSLAVSIPS